MMFAVAGVVVYLWVKGCNKWDVMAVGLFWGLAVVVAYVFSRVCV